VNFFFLVMNGGTFIRLDSVPSQEQLTKYRQQYTDANTHMTSLGIHVIELYNRTANDTLQIDEINLQLLLELDQFNGLQTIENTVRKTVNN